MKANKYISKNEHKLLLTVAFISFVYVASAFCYGIVKDYNYSVIKEEQRLEYLANYNREGRISGSSPTTGLPGLHLLTLFIFVALLKTKRFLLSSFLTIFYAIVFTYGLSAGYYARLLGGEEFSPKVYFFVRLYREADIFDYLAALFISILLFWQIPILLRMLVKTLQKEKALP